MNLNVQVPCHLFVDFCTYNFGTGYDYPDLPRLGNGSEKLELPGRLSAGVQFRFGNLFHGKVSGGRGFICWGCLILLLPGVLGRIERINIIIYQFVIDNTF